MLVGNATGKRIRLSIMKDKTEDETYEAFAYIIADGNSLNLPDSDNFVISLEE